MGDILWHYVGGMWDTGYRLGKDKDMTTQYLSVGDICKMAGWMPFKIYKIVDATTVVADFGGFASVVKVDDSLVVWV